MNKKIIVSYAVVALLALPTLILAFGHPATPSVGGAVDLDALIGNILDIVWMVASAFFIIMFVIAGFKFATAGGNPEGVAEARSAAIYGAVGVAVAIIAFSIVTLVSGLI